MASEEPSATTDTTRDFLRSFSVIDVDSDESDYDELPPLPETDTADAPGDNIIGEADHNNVTYGESHASRIIPYKSIFAPAVPFSNQRDNCWIPGVAITVSIVSYDRQPALKILNPNLYTIEATHGEYHWTIYRRYKHFRQLHDSLALFRAKYSLPLPSRDYHQRRATIKRDLKDMRQQKVVRFPLRPEALVSEEQIPLRMQQLQEYLQNLLTCKSYRNHPETLKFLEVSHLSFVNKTGIKAKEGLVKKCSGGRRINIQCCGCLQNLHFAGTWNKRWLVLKDSYLLYIRPEDGHISDVLLMDSAFSVKSGISNTGAKHGCLIENMSRKLLIKCWTSRKAREWAEQISFVAENHGTDYTRKNRFTSFAPPREDSYARWFVDGKTYFEAVADALEKAKEEIYITDWWLSPEIYMKRPIVDGDHWRLDIILKRKADQGVKIFILLYKEIKVALNIVSDYSKQTLMSHCPENIKVLRHPDHIPGKGVLMWAHHEKLVIIDQQIAFAGGLDLCYGRWDDEFHKMTDLGSVTLKNGTSTNLYKSNGSLPQEYSSHTDISVVTDDSSPWVTVTPSSPVSHDVVDGAIQTKKISKNNSSNQQLYANNSYRGSSLKTKNNIPDMTTAEKLSSSQDLSASNNSTSSKDSTSSTSHLLEDVNLQDTEIKQLENRSEHSSSSHPIDVNVVVTITSPSIDDGDNDNVMNDKQGYTASTSKIEDKRNSRKSSSHNQLNARPNVNTGSRSVSKKQLVRQTSSVIDTEGFSDTILGEIDESMTPFKDLHNESYFNMPHEEVNLEDLSFDTVNPGFTDILDTEIITSMNADNYPKHSGKSTPSNSPLHKRKGSHADKKVKTSHLWSRRSKKKSLELVIPSKNGTYKKTDDSDNEDAHSNVEVDNRSQLSDQSKNCQRQSPEVKKVQNNLETLDDADRCRRNSDSSQTSKASDSDNVATKLASSQTSPQNELEAKDSLPPTVGVSHRQFSFTGAANAINAFRKMMHRKEPNNNEEEENASDGMKEESSNAARRRWKMIFNVSKFETIVRAPQEPEMVDENLFYNQNINHPNTRDRLMRTFREGVDKLSRHGGRRDSMDLDLKLGKSILLTPTGMHHTESEEHILERGLVGSTRLWIGKDYVNFIYKDFVNLHQPFEDFIDRTKYPRMPWHDIGCVLYGKSARDLARHFIGRWNFTKLEKCKRNPNFPLLIPKTLSNCTITRAIKDITFEVKAQVLRSCGGWSAGIGEVERSIHDAYEHCIENARNYIYIENQFFITQVGNYNTVQNGIGKALYKRILRAHRSNSDFKVYVVMPLLPAFEGEFGTNTGAALQAVTHWNYSSICRGGYSLMEKLAQEVPDPNKYIVFCGLRSWDKLDGKLFTELIYVHSKLMIVDDDTVIIGSANINDRSLLGSRDSEIAVMFEDIHKVNVTVNGKQYQAGRFASSLRWTIFREHLGIHNDPDFVDLTDITSDSFYKEIWIKRAAVNTTCYDKVFKCLPTDNVKNYAQLREYQATPPLAKTNEEEAMKLLKKVKGYLVLMPLQFLREEKLSPRVGQKEAMLPTHLWT